jgi:hypothetical protein
MLRHDPHFTKQSNLVAATLMLEASSRQQACNPFVQHLIAAFT